MFVLPQYTFVSRTFVYPFPDSRFIFIRILEFRKLKLYYCNLLCKITIWKWIHIIYPFPIDSWLETLVTDIFKFWNWEVIGTNNSKLLFFCHLSSSVVIKMLRQDIKSGSKLLLWNISKVSVVISFLVICTYLIKKNTEGILRILEAFKLI